MDMADPTVSLLPPHNKQRDSDSRIGDESFRTGHVDPVEDASGTGRGSTGRMDEEGQKELSEVSYGRCEMDKDHHRYV